MTHHKPIIAATAMLLMSACLDAPAGEDPELQTSETAQLSQAKLTVFPGGGTVRVPRNEFGESYVFVASDHLANFEIFAGPQYHITDTSFSVRCNGVTHTYNRHIKFTKVSLTDVFITCPSGEFLQSATSELFSNNYTSDGAGAAGTTIWIP